MEISVDSNAFTNVYFAFVARLASTKYVELVEKENKSNSDVEETYENKLQK